MKTEPKKQRSLVDETKVQLIEKSHYEVFAALNIKIYSLSMNIETICFMPQWVKKVAFRCRSGAQNSASFFLPDTDMELLQHLPSLGEFVAAEADHAKSITAASRQNTMQINSLLHLVELGCYFKRKASMMQSAIALKKISLATIACTAQIIGSEHVVAPGRNKLQMTIGGVGALLPRPARFLIDQTVCNWHSGRVIADAL